MLEHTTGFVKIIDGEHIPVYYDRDAQEAHLEDDEYYAIFIEEDIYRNSEIVIEADVGYITTLTGKEYFVYSFEYYGDYAYELAKLERF